MEIFNNLAQSTVILTPNRRLAATLLKNFQSSQLEKGTKCWSTIDILPFQSWIQRIWDEVALTHMQDLELILSNANEYILWENIIKESPKNDSLIELAETTELAKSAWATLQQWQIDVTHPLFAMTEDCLAFQEWATRFIDHCQKNHWIDFNSVISKVIVFINQALYSPPENIRLIGFTELTPLQKRLFACCVEKNTNIEELENPHPAPNQKCFYISLTNTETEIYTMARWAKQILEDNKQNKSLNIGCIIPTLESERDRVSQIFSEICDAEDFNISAGKGLTTYPIIHAAISLIKLNPNVYSFKDLRFILHTPFISYAETERTNRANCEVRLRRENIHTIDQDQLEHYLFSSHCPELSKRLLEFKTVCFEKNSILKPSAWVQKIMERLKLFGWPGERSLHSQEYQVVQRFIDLLHEYQSFDNILPQISWSDALSHIERLGNKIIFQPQSIDAPIQILGLLEAANIHFDYAWVAGLDDSAWPPPAKPSPFIPQKLQKNFNMPHANAEKELQYCTKLNAQLKQSINTLIFSHALQQEDYELRPSALITDNPKIFLKDIEQYDFRPLAEIIYQSQEIEKVLDETAPSVNVDEIIKGGVSIFKQQAACPFRSFSEIRLHARELPKVSMGFRPEHRGTMTHKALEHIWQHLQNHEILTTIEESTLANLIKECVDRAIEEQSTKKISEKRYLALESLRLQKLLTDWLTLEKTRPPFTVIAHEKTIELTIGNIPITIRVDRIDELEQGNHIIIDYKTGKNNHIKYWFGDRPEEPQLPLYCLSNSTNVKAIAFATVHPEKLAMTGISDQETSIDQIQSLQNIDPDKHLNWDQQIQAWQSSFDQLANQFMQGIATVSPKNAIETCQYCALKSFCRIHESTEEFT